MSVDFYNCGGCGEIDSDCAPLHNCSNCGSTVFDCCYDEMVKKFGVINSTDIDKFGINIESFYGKGSLKGCNQCMNTEQSSQIGELNELTDGTIEKTICQDKQVGLQIHRNDGAVVKLWIKGFMIEE